MRVASLITLSLLEVVDWTLARVAEAMKIDFFKGDVLRCRSGDLEKDCFVRLSEDSAVWFYWRGVTYCIDFIMIFPEPHSQWRVFGTEYSVR
jgi:hypothetical protein